MSYENGTISSSPHCSSRFSKFMLDFRALAGVPVLNLLSFRPSSAKDLPNKFAGKIPSGPLEYDVSPICTLPSRNVPVAKTTHVAEYFIMFLEERIHFPLASSRLISVISACFRERFCWSSNLCFITSLYLFLSICTRSDLTAGPLPILSILLCKKHSSAVLPISPPRASISLTRCPFAVPPIEGLHGQFPTESKLTANTAVLHPSLAAARPASIPAWPAPIIITS